MRAAKSYKMLKRCPTMLKVAKSCQMQPKVHKNGHSLPKIGNVPKCVKRCKKVPCHDMLTCCQDYMIKGSYVSNSKLCPPSDRLTHKGKLKRCQQQPLVAKSLNILLTINARVAKYQLFYTKQNLQTKFYPRKNAQIGTKLTTYNGTFGKQLLQNYVFSQTFTPTCHYFNIHVYRNFKTNFGKFLLFTICFR